MSRAVARTLLLLVVVAAGCRREGTHVAELVEASGKVDREHAAAWAQADRGARFVVGDAVRTGSDGSARLLVRPSARLRLGAEALLRFRGGPSPEQAALRFETGVAEIEGDTAVLVDTRAGVARAEPGTRLRVRSTADATMVEVIVGRAALLTASGELAINEGEGVRATGDGPPERYALDVGKAELEAPSAAPDAAPVAPPAPVAPVAEAPPPSSPAARASRDEGETPGADAAATRDVEVAAGESFTVHALRVPVTVRLGLTSLGCDGSAVVVVKPQKVAGTSAVVVSLPPGIHRYKARCATGGKGVVGRIVVARDAGTAAVARQPPTNAVEVDGRKYTIIYQGRPPALKVVWPAAPAAGPFELHALSRGHDDVRTSAKPELTVPSGALTDGEHRLWFTAGGARSKDTSVAIAFQNAAVTAQIRSPAPRARWGDGPIDVAGVAVEGSRVTIDGAEVETDAAGRFTTSVALPPADRPLAVRIEHPKGGVHYYLRHRPR